MLARIPHEAGRLLALAALGGLLAAKLGARDEHVGDRGTWRGGPLHGLAGHLSPTDHRWAMVALLVTSISLWPWYLAWVLPLAALAGDVTLSVAALALTGASLGVLLM